MPAFRPVRISVALPIRSPLRTEYSHAPGWTHKLQCGPSRCDPHAQENAIQLLGGIGITDEQDEGLFFKRLRVLHGLFGDADYRVDRFQRLGRFDA